MRRIRVLIVDDAVVVRRIVGDVLAEDPDIEIVGTAANGRIALQKLTQVTPDLVTLDVEMPEMDGLETLKALRTTHPRLPVIMFSSLTERGASTTIEALALGASDYVTKSASAGGAGVAQQHVRDELIPKIKALCPVTGEAGLASRRGGRVRSRKSFRICRKTFLCRSSSCSTCRRCSPSVWQIGSMRSPPSRSERPPAAKSCGQPRCSSRRETITWCCGEAGRRS
jgi:chemotaxis response regulator CheB